MIGSKALRHLSVLIFLLLLLQMHNTHNIQDFGAIPHSDILKSQQTNSQAIKLTIFAANSSKTDRTVVLSKKVYYSMPVNVDNIHNISIVIEGRLSASKSVKDWPRQQPHKGGYDHFLSFSKCSGIQMSGGGRIDGRGYIWWALSWINSQKYLPAGASRPKLIRFDEAKNISVHDLILKNSPSFHIVTDQLIDSKFYNLDIKVNTTAQFNLLKKFSVVGIMPTFPLNTDGIDPSGKNIHIYNITCQNYDDVVVPKPTHQTGIYTNCTQDMLVENITVRLGVGMSIGSVPPHEGTNCIRNITFRNVYMKRPFKGIYVKTNPGNNGDGLVQNIRYQNITMDRPIWWAIYIGPQQQKQPDGGGPGCMLYPFDPHGTCSTQPRVTVRDIVLKDISIHLSLLFPIIMRCNSTNPCKDFVFDNVRVDSWSIGGKRYAGGYVCEEVSGWQKNSFPKPACLTQIKDHNDEKTKTNAITRQTNQFPFSASVMLHQYEKASQEIPYEQIDDQMFISTEDLKTYELLIDTEQLLQ